MSWCQYQLRDPYINGDIRWRLKSCTALSTFYLGSYGIIVYYGHAGFLVSSSRGPSSRLVQSLIRSPCPLISWGGGACPSCTDCSDFHQVYKVTELTQVNCLVLEFTKFGGWVGS